MLTIVSYPLVRCNSERFRPEWVTEGVVGVYLSNEIKIMGREKQLVTTCSWCTVNRLRHIKAVSGEFRPPTATPIRTAYMEWGAGWAGGHQHLKKPNRRGWMLYLSRYLIVVRDACMHVKIYITVKPTYPMLMEAMNLSILTYSMQDNVRSVWHKVCQASAG